MAYWFKKSVRKVEEKWHKNSMPFFISIFELRKHGKRYENNTYLWWHGPNFSYEQTFIEALAVVYHFSSVKKTICSENCLKNL